MLCMNNYPQPYIDTCRMKMAAHVASFSDVIAAAQGQAASTKAPLVSALASLETHFFNNLLLALDTHFVHRARALEKKDGNPLNEVRLLCHALLNEGSLLTADKSIKYDPAKAVLKVPLGGRVELTQDDFVRLSAAFFAEVESKYL